MRIVLKHLLLCILIFSPCFCFAEQIIYNDNGYCVKIYPLTDNFNVSYKNKPVPKCCYPNSADEVGVFDDELYKKYKKECVIFKDMVQIEVSVKMTGISAIEPFLFEIKKIALNNYSCNYISSRDIRITHFDNYYGDKAGLIHSVSTTCGICFTESDILQGMQTEVYQNVSSTGTR